MPVLAGVKMFGGWKQKKPKTSPKISRRQPTGSRQLGIGWFGTRSHSVLIGVLSGSVIRAYSASWGLRFLEASLR